MFSQCSSYVVAIHLMLATHLKCLIDTIKNGDQELIMYMTRQAKTFLNSVRDVPRKGRYRTEQNRTYLLFRLTLWPHAGGIKENYECKIVSKYIDRDPNSLALPSPNPSTIPSRSHHIWRVIQSYTVCIALGNPTIISSIKGGGTEQSRVQTIRETVKKLYDNVNECWNKSTECWIEHSLVECDLWTREQRCASLFA